MDKVRYFLKTFKNLEWSGPAWYSHTKDENGFPEEIKLEYFHPLDLGTASSTDWDGEELIKIYKDLRKEFPQIGKEWVQGNIHSHHTMGAFFSGTDEQQLEDGANDQFYYSLVVSSKPGKELYFGVSWPDQFGQIHILVIDDIEVENNTTFDKEWKKQATIIKKNKKPEPVTLYKRNGYGYYNNAGQGTLFANNAKKKPTTQEQETKQDRYEAHVDWLSYNGGIKDDSFDAYSWEIFEAYDEILLKYDKGKIKKKEMIAQLKKLGVDEYGRPLS